MKRRLRLFLWCAAAVAFVLGGILQFADRFLPQQTLTDETAVHFIDVGQGDSALLLSGGQAVLIDAGTAESGAAVVRYLEDLGVTRLYAAVATHPHADHIGGMAQVLDTFPVEHFYMGPETQNTTSFSDLLDALQAQGIQPTIPAPGDTLAFDSGATLTFLGPADDVPDGNLNDRSLITLFQADEQKVLLMGDAESAAEQSLLAHYPSLRCDVLKVGHHGGATSSSLSFLQTIQPSVAVISCGVDNDYGHPDPQTLQNLSLAGVSDVRITAECGTVIFPLHPPSSSKENAA
ncbi:ComEC/Rec2 family competence protein [uncultured Agathobaculum sp.]|uniref:ComEC/Rec2 family competence protein n=1 Tax=uncultured Agathobaculum sp. TaxID=2048140 RepID=UPI0026057073|nr:ComEC/Rec2 family competence protein [uncultured Agathobaculum sp.]